MTILFFDPMRRKKSDSCKIHTKFSGLFPGSYILIFHLNIRTFFFISFSFFHHMDVSKTEFQFLLSQNVFSSLLYSHFTCFSYFRKCSAPQPKCSFFNSQINFLFPFIFSHKINTFVLSFNSPIRRIRFQGNLILIFFFFGWYLCVGWTKPKVRERKKKWTNWKRRTQRRKSRQRKLCTGL